MGYKKNTILLAFPDLVEDDEQCFVKIRNPKLQTIEKLMPSDDVNENDREALKEAVFGIMASLVLDWRVWDPEDESDDPDYEPEPFGLPATAEMIAKLPVEITNAIQAEVEAALPLPKTP